MKNVKFIRQLFPTYLFIVFISLAAVTYYATATMRDFHLDETAEDIKTRAEFFRKTVEPLLETGVYDGLDAYCDASGKISDTRITIVLPDGKVICDSKRNTDEMDNHKNRPEIMDAVGKGFGRSIRYSHTLKQEMMYGAVPVKINNELKGIVRTAVPVRKIDEKITGLQLRVIFGGVLISLIAAWISWYISRKITIPIEELTQSAERFAEGELDAELIVPDTKELIDLAKTMKHMAKQLDGRIKTISRQKNTLNAILTGMVEGVVAVDENHEILLVNESGAEMFGQSVSEITGGKAYDVIRNAGFLQFVEDCFKAEKFIQGDISFHKMQESILHLHGTPLISEDKRIGILIVINDVTKIRRLEMARQDFVTNISHEIKTPLTPIKAAVEIIRDISVENKGDKNEDVERFFHIMEKNINRLSTTIKDLVTLSGIENKSGDVLKNREPIDIQSVLEDVVVSMEAKFKKREIALITEYEGNPTVNLHIGLFKRAIANLLDNAVKNSSSGDEINISVSTSGKELEVRVKDQGKGIPEKHLSRVFERFYRVEDDRSSKTGGSGLGLSIVKHVVNAHGGDIRVKSTYGKGSEFIIRIRTA